MIYFELKIAPKNILTFCVSRRTIKLRNEIKKGCFTMELKQERLSLRLTSEEKKLIRKKSIDKNMKISEYIMNLVEKDFQSSKHNDSLNVEYGKVENSIKCISEMVNNFKEHDKTAMTPLLSLVVNELMQELESLKESLKVKNLID